MSDTPPLHHGQAEPVLAAIRPAGVSPRPQRLLLVGSAKKPESAALIANVMPWVSERGQTTACLTADLRDVESVEPLDNLSLVVSFGGDGTLLGLARQMADRGLKAPVLGVNLGRLGYMAEFSVEEFRQSLDAALTGALTVRLCRMLLVSVEAPLPPEGGSNGAALRPVSPAGVVVSAGPPRFVSHAFNDVVINAGPPYRMLTLDVSLDGRRVTTVGGDGLIVATPLGSTAYNLAAGGPIIQPNVAALAITPICAHTLNHRPIVVNDTATVEVANARPTDASQLVIDGQVNCPLTFADRVRIRRSDYQLALVENPCRTSFDTLREKLHWGVGPV